MHVAIQKLSMFIAPGETTVEEMAALFGMPDNKYLDGGLIYRSIIDLTQWSNEPIGELWAYHWRGAHDQFLVAVDGGVVTSIGWLMSWE